MSRIRSTLHADGGFTLIEVLIAGLILVVGLLGTLAAMDSGKRSTTGSQRNQEALSFAQSYLEALTATKWSQLGYTTANLPRSEVDATPAERSPSTPAAYLTGCSGGAGSACTGLAIHQDPLDRNSAAPTGVTSPEPFVTVASGGISPKLTLPGGAGAVYQYVTTASDECVTVSGTQRCPGKRLSVAVLLNADVSHSLTKPVWLSTVVTDPGVQPL
jgi:type II secretory pathway pseudopilin PulG